MESPHPYGSLRAVIAAVPREALWAAALFFAFWTWAKAEKIGSLEHRITLICGEIHAVQEALFPEPELLPQLPQTSGLTAEQIEANLKEYGRVLALLDLNEHIRASELWRAATQRHPIGQRLLRLRDRCGS